MLRKLILIEKKEITRGKNKQGGDWILYSVTDSEKKQYSTFDDVPVNTEIELEYTEKPYIDKKTGAEKIGHNLAYPKKEKGVDPSVIKELRESIISLNQRMDFLEIRVKTLSKEDEVPDPENPFLQP